MANQPPVAVMNTVAGYPVYSSQDTGGTKVTPYGLYLWNPLSGTSGLWLPAPVDANGNQQVALSGSITQLDASTALLGANASYTTGTPFSLAPYKRIVGSILSDQPGTLFIQQSTDGTNFDVVSNINIAAIPAAWAQNATVTTGQQVRANGNVYQCTTGGTTSSSGTGPSGTGIAITDNTATWKYVSPVIGQSIDVHAVGVKGQLTLVNGSTAQGLLRLWAGGKNI